MARIEQPTMPAAPNNDDAEAALIATFYGPRRQLGTLHTRIYRGFAGNPLDAVPLDWSNGTVHLRCFDPVAAHDTTIIQLVLNTSGTIATAWRNMRHYLEGILDDEVLQGVWGYTLIYQAATPVEGDLDSTFNDTLPGIDKLHAAEDVKSLARADMMGGRVWLMAIPLYADGGVASMIVYVALSPPDQEATFVREVLYGPSAALLMPDLIAHKAYYQMRQYRGLEQTYIQKIADIRESTGVCLSKLERKITVADELDSLARAYNLFLEVVPTFSELRMSLARQLHNYDWWRAQNKQNDVLEFHRNHIETATVEVDLLVTQGRDVLETAGTVVAMAQVQVDKAQAFQQQQTSTLLAVLAVILAVPAVIDPAVAGALLQCVGWQAPANGYNVLLLFGVRVVITLVLALLLASWLRWTAMRRKR